jgi:hypothetical protein
MRIRSIAILLLLVVAAGCSSGRKTVPFTGEVKTRSGEPVTGVRVVLEPATGTKIGATFGYDLDRQGRFEGEAYEGDYIFYLSPVSVQRDDDDSTPINAREAKKYKDSTQVLNRFPAAYKTTTGGGAEHVATITSGANLSLVVAK